MQRGGGWGVEIRFRLVRGVKDIRMEHQGRGRGSCLAPKGYSIPKANPATFQSGVRTVGRTLLSAIICSNFRRCSFS